ncbi:MAG: YraN family protein [Gammaproteobacteria bacterium]|nr:YraN family protein [Gammaproteobacteria bacterium]MCW9088857.1 YraN family protein [Gammaproteobacteria bacterium]
MGRTRTEIGQQAELLAAEYLSNNGLRLIERNYRCRGGEIDLVMEDGMGLVFVEVRYRKHQAFGGAAASVDRHKQQRLIRAAQYYLQRKHCADRPCRFDVIAVSPGPQGKPALQWIRNAIELD